LAKKPGVVETSTTRKKMVEFKIPQLHNAFTVVTPARSTRGRPKS